MSKSDFSSVSRSRFILTLAVALFVFVALGLQIFPSRHVQAISTPVVISEFRTRGPSGANDEFVELYNVTGSPIDIGGWKINRSNGTGTINTQITITAGTMIPAFGHFLATNSAAGGYSGSVPGNQTYGVGITDDGGIAILDGSNAIIDQVGMSAGSAYKEGPVLSQLTTSVNRSHERKPGGASGSAQDTDNNGSDFQLITPSDPQNLASAPTPSGSPTTTPSPTPTPSPTATNPTGVGAANPSALLAGSQTLLTVTVTPGSNPASTGLNVLGNLSSIGGSATQQFFDDGTNGDFVVGNNVFSYSATVSIATTPGAKTIPFSITDAQSRSGSGNISLTVTLHDPAEHMVMGNPSNAIADESMTANYLMMKPQYALSYNNDKGTSNWTSWHLDSNWATGVADRQNDFRSDDTLPPGFKHISDGYQFATYGFERGHMCPSADRTSSVPDNSATFLMTNMVPQARGNNQGPWGSMEDYIRTQLNGTANELYIVSGGAGVGGNTSTGHWDSIIDTAGNTVTVPHVTWKVVMVLPNATGDDVARVSTSTRTFAVIMPNDDDIRPDQWDKYLATVDQVEALSSYDFYSDVPTTVQGVIEARLDAENDTAPVTSDQIVTTVKDQGVAVTLSATDFNVNNTFTYTIVNAPMHGSLSGSNGSLTYSPIPHYVGPDLFTFKANDGAKDSNVSTVTIKVIEPPSPSCSVLNNGEWIIEALDASIPEAPFEVRINGNPVCTTTKLLAFANRVSDTSRFPQVFDIYSSGYIRMKAGADPSPPLPFGQSLVLGPAIFGTSVSFPAPTLFFRPQLQRVDIDTSQLHPDGTGTLFISVTANDSGLAPTSTNTNQIMNQTWGITLHEPTNDQTRIDVAGTFTFTETAVPDATRTAEFQSFRLLQISSMFIDSDHHDVDAFRYRDASGLVKFFYNPGCVDHLCPPNPSALDPSTGILDSLHTDDVGQPNGNTPSFRILMGTTTGPVSGPITPRAFITPSQNVNDDNLGLWLHQQPLNVILQGTSGSISYTVVATTDPLPGDTVVQLSKASYSVGEGDSSVIATVNRSGDTSGPATVNYATSDTSGANKCNVFNGAASSRCDYLTTLGTLRFAATETSKTISIPIVDDSYAEGSESFTITLSNPASATLGSLETAKVTVTDNETVTGTNPIDTPNFFVRQHYLDFLNREPDPPGFGFWTGEIDNCTPKPQCTEIRRINVSAAFYLSIEFQGTGYLVERIYKASYGDAGGTSTFNGAHQLLVPMVRFNEFLSDTQEIGQGVIVNQGNWQQQLEDNKNAFTTEFVQRSRFVTAFPPSMTPAQFVDKLNTSAGTPLSQLERDQLVNDLSTSAKTRAQVLRAVAEDPDLNTAEYNRAFVLMQYFGYLRRNPNDPQDSDHSGYDFWLTKLNQFNGNFVNAEMVKAFIVSGEYRQRFGP